MLIKPYRVLLMEERYDSNMIGRAEEDIQQHTAPDNICYVLETRIVGHASEGDGSPTQTRVLRPLRIMYLTRTVRTLVAHTRGSTICRVNR